MISRTHVNPASDNPTFLDQRERIFDGMRKRGGAGGMSRSMLSSDQLVEQRLSFSEIACIEAFGEPAVDRRK